MAAKKKPEAPRATEPVTPAVPPVQEPAPAPADSEGEPVEEQWDEEDIPPAEQEQESPEPPPAPAVVEPTPPTEPPPPPRFTARIPATKGVFHGDDLEALKTTVQDHLAENKLVGDIDRLITTNF